MDPTNDKSAELLALKDELAAELLAMTRLHELSTRLLASTELQPLLEEVLKATTALQNADFGNVQLYNRETQALEIVAQHGLQQDCVADRDDRLASPGVHWALVARGYAQAC